MSKNYPKGFRRLRVQIGQGQSVIEGAIYDPEQEEDGHGYVYCNVPHHAVILMGPHFGMVDPIDEAALLATQAVKESNQHVLSPVERIASASEGLEQMFNSLSREEKDDLERIMAARHRARQQTLETLADELEARGAGGDGKDAGDDDSHAPADDGAGDGGDPVLGALGQDNPLKGAPERDAHAQEPTWSRLGVDQLRKWLDERGIEAAPKANKETLIKTCQDAWQDPMVKR